MVTDPVSKPFQKVKQLSSAKYIKKIAIYKYNINRIFLK